MNKFGTDEKRRDTERKMEMAIEFIREAVVNRIGAGTWGRIVVSAIVENGFIKEIQLEDHTTIREVSCILPRGK